MGNNLCCQRAEFLDIAGNIGRYVSEDVQGTGVGKLRARGLGTDKVYVIHEEKGYFNPVLSQEENQKEHVLRLPCGNRIPVKLPQGCKITNRVSYKCDPLHVVSMKDDRTDAKTKVVDVSVHAAADIAKVAAEMTANAKSHHKMGVGKATIDFLYEQPLGSIELSWHPNAPPNGDPYITALEFGHQVKLRMELEMDQYDENFAVGAAIKARGILEDGAGEGAQLRAVAGAGGAKVQTSGPLVQSLQVTGSKVPLDTKNMNKKPLTEVYNQILDTLAKNEVNPTTWQELGISVSGHAHEKKSSIDAPDASQEARRQRGSRRDISRRDSDLDAMLSDAGIQNPIKRGVYAKWFRENAYESKEAVYEVTLQIMMDGAKMTPSHASKLYKYLHDDKVEGRHPGVERLLKELEGLVSEEALDQIEDTQITLENFQAIIGYHEEFSKLFPKHRERELVKEQFRNHHGWAPGTSQPTNSLPLPSVMAATWAKDSKGDKGQGKTKYFASLSNEAKLAVLRHVSREEAAKFEGKGSGEGKTKYFANLSEEEKRDALQGYHRSIVGTSQIRRTWKAEKGTGKVKFFASLPDAEKLDVLKYSSRLEEMKQFSGTGKEGKTAFFAKLSEQEKVDALNRWESSKAAGAKSWTSQNGTGKVQFFASLSSQEKLKVLNLTGIPDVWSRFQGDAQHEGKTAFFAALSEEVKANALNAFSKASCSFVGRQ